jgi:hypothetical protein
MVAARRAGRPGPTTRLHAKPPEPVLGGGDRTFGPRTAGCPGEVKFSGHGRRSGAAIARRPSAAIAASRRGGLAGALRGRLGGTARGLCAGRLGDRWRRLSERAVSGRSPVPIRLSVVPVGSGPCVDAAAKISDGRSRPGRGRPTGEPAPERVPRGFNRNDHRNWFDPGNDCQKAANMTPCDDDADPGQRRGVRQPALPAPAVAKILPPGAGERLPAPATPGHCQRRCGTRLTCALTARQGRTARLVAEGGRRRGAGEHPRHGDGGRPNPFAPRPFTPAFQRA